MYLLYLQYCMACTALNCEVRSEPSESGAACPCWRHHMTCQFFFDCPWTCKPESWKPWRRPKKWRASSMSSDNSWEPFSSEASHAQLITWSTPKSHARISQGILYVVHGGIWIGRRQSIEVFLQNLDGKLLFLRVLCCCERRIWLQAVPRKSRFAVWRWGWLLE